ncbi:MAG: ABC transporter ATP-binding protein [Patescibacteria group bacterium]|nr:ABC transporter ATP-binding protein [Patescibacteria group bacterium]MDE1945351.1 ABC transporter ATP-binding protein [Patescibacteria group bacterium]MDE2058026.1 ABC transporter ATP-binding protein [Patescibacteria group bacterium]
MDALTIEHLEKTYKGAPAPALGGVSLRIGAGEFYALLGPNGAGKTTLIGIVTGLVQPSGGRVEVFGIDAAKEPEKARLKIGVVPQNMNFNIFDKVIDIVVNQAGYYGIPRSVALPRAAEILTGVGLGDKVREQAMKLSGGMQRRLMIARALIHEPALLILDEPTAGVDVEMRRSMWEYLTGLVAKGTTILLTTHYLEEAEQLANRVAIINKGQIVTEGKMDEVLALYDESKARAGYRGSRLEEVFIQLTSANEAKA